MRHHLSTALLILATYWIATVAAAQTVARPPATLRDAIRTGVTGGLESDRVAASVVVPAAAPARQVDALAGYVRNDFAGGDGRTGNGVAAFLMAVGNADRASVWGSNVIVTDDPDTQRVHAHAGRKLIGSEYDFANTAPGTEISGIGLTGSSLVQPAYAVGFLASHLSSQAPGRARWTNAFASVDGAVLPGGSALSIGKRDLRGPANPSQALSWSYGDAAGRDQNYRAAVATNGNLVFTGTAPDRTVTFDRMVYAAGPIVSNAYLRTTPVAFSVLATRIDTAPQLGDRAFVTDATACTFNAPVTGGGTTPCPVVFTTRWVAG